MPSNKMATIEFSTTVAAGTNVTLTKEIRQAGTIERIFGKFYPGQQNTLHVRPYLVMSQGRIDELIDYPDGANQFISGDDRTFDIPVSFEVLPNDVIKVYADNTGAYDYTLQISVVVDYQAGTSRA